MDCSHLETSHLETSHLPPAQIDQLAAHLTSPPRTSAEQHSVLILLGTPQDVQNALTRALEAVTQHHLRLDHVPWADLRPQLSGRGPARPAGSVMVVPDVPGLQDRDRKRGLTVQESGALLELARHRLRFSGDPARVVAHGRALTLQNLTGPVICLSSRLTLIPIGEYSPAHADAWVQSIWDQQT